MHEPIKRVLSFLILSTTALLITSLILRPTLIPKSTTNTLSIAITIKAFLQSFKSFNVLLTSAKSHSTIGIERLLKPYTLPSLTPLIISSIRIEERELTVAVIYKNELILSSTLTYNAITLPSSGIFLPKDLQFSNRRVIIIHDDGHKLVIELIPYYNYTLKDNVLTIDIFLFRCKLKLREEMHVHFLDYVETTMYLRSYESIGDIKVLFNGSNVIHEYAKVIIIRVHYEVWAIE